MALTSPLSPLWRPQTDQNAFNAPTFGAGLLERTLFGAGTPGAQQVDPLGHQAATGGFGQSISSPLLTSGWQGVLGRLQQGGIQATTPSALQGLASLTSNTAAQSTQGIAPSGAVGHTGQTGTQADSANPYLDSAAQRFGVPANVIKAILINESSGNIADANRVAYLRGDVIAPYVGIFNSAWQSWGCPGSVESNVGNPQAQIDCLARGLKLWYDRAKATNPAYGWENVASMHFSGHYEPYGWQDENGMSDIDYVNNFKQTWTKFDQEAGVSGTGGAASTPAAQAFSGTTPAHTQQVLDIAKSYVGVPYVWGGIPGRGQDPWNSGWDCSGFTYWLDQNYGDGQLPMGSHYQYQDAQQKGKLFTDTAQLQPGDLLFFATGFTGGGGSELNPASHVGIYLGNDQFIQAANPDQGTIISNFSGYYQNEYIGGEHMSWSGGGSGVGAQIGAAAAGAAGSATQGGLSQLYQNFLSSANSGSSYTPLTNFHNWRNF